MTRILLLVVFVVVTAPVFAQSPHEWPLHLALEASMTAEGADLASTMYAMGRGGFREVNPLFRPLSHRPVSFAVAKMGGIAAMNLLLIRLHRQHPRWAMIMAIANTVLKSYAAVRNQRLILRSG